MKKSNKYKWELFTINNSENYISLGKFVCEKVTEAEKEAVKRAKERGICVPSVSVVIVQEKENG